MPNNYFRFKQFQIYQDDAAMKVGTDGVLLGAWAGLEGSEKRILDIGTGTGLIALMAAQRAPDACVDAVEIDPPAARQARGNVDSSPWPQRIRVHNLSIQDFVRKRAERSPAVPSETGLKAIVQQNDRWYDHILSNPPFFVGSLKAPDVARRTARHADTLCRQELIRAVDFFLAPDGRFTVIYPPEEASVFECEARKAGLVCCRKTRVRGTPESPVKRILMEFTRRQTGLWEDELTIEIARHRYTPEYIALTRDFYLNF